MAKGGEKMQSIKIITDISKIYNLKNRQKISLDTLNKISYEQKVHIKDLVFILGGYSNIIYKKESTWTRINLNKEYSVKEKVKLIKIKFKHLEGCGARLYAKEEIEKECAEFGITLEEFMLYLKRCERCYYENMEIISKNKGGIWIGENPQLSSKFLNENAEILMSGIEKNIRFIINKYSCRDKEPELKNFGFIKLMEHGEMERNFQFDKDRAISKLLFRIKYDIIDYLITEFKISNFSRELGNTIYNVEEEEKEGNLEIWLYPIRFNIIQNFIIDEFKQRLNDLLEHRKRTFRIIYKKLGISREVFYNNLYEIQQLMIKFKKVKLCKYGKVVINNE